MSEIRVFAPASVSNVTCGFDILGFALDDLGDEIAARVVEEPGVRIESITGDDGRLPHDARLNTASIAAQAVLDRLQERSAEGLLPPSPADRRPRPSPRPRQWLRCE